LKEEISYRLKKNDKIVIITITPPHTNSLIGYRLKKRFPQIKFICDWQDLWTYDDYHLKKTAKFYHTRLRRLESMILTYADMNIVTNEFAARILSDDYNIPKSQIAHIYHPFDRVELSRSLNQRASNCKYKFAFLGHFIKPPKVRGEKILAALYYCNKNGIDLEFNIYGDEQEITKEFLRNYSYDFVNLHKRVSHRESLNNLLYNDFLLLSLEDLPNTKIIMHGKLPHYLMLKIPIIAFVPKDSFVAQLINNTKSGSIICKEEQTNDILYRIVKNFNLDKYLSEREEEEIEKLSWVNVSKEWIQVFSSLTDEG
jgi:glycosyltransferase involved in cell wall biosynthesis